jgi:hypothetical protein
MTVADTILVEKVSDGFSELTRACFRKVARAFWASRHSPTIPFTDGAQRSYHKTARRCERRLYHQVALTGAERGVGKWDRGALFLQCGPAQSHHPRQMRAPSTTDNR